MVLLIDNYDSFTYNLVQSVKILGKKTSVHLNDGILLDEIEKQSPSHIILSPGPGKPKDAGICNNVIEKFSGKIPILGVCLGHQCIGDVYGSRVIKAKNQLHGKTSPVYHENKGVFYHCPNPMVAGRYHSLALDRVPDGFFLTAWDQDKEIMGIQHDSMPVFGVQFHPESFLTPEGSSILEAFLEH